MTNDLDTYVPEVKQNEFIPTLTEAQKLYNTLRFEMINFLMNTHTKRIQAVIN